MIVKLFVKDNRLFFLLFLSYLLALLIIQPWGNYPLNDDWSYAKSVLSIDQVGHVDIGEWPAMTLYTHAMWGYLFIKLFGFSFLVLRFSTWVSMCIGVFSFYRLGEKLTGNKQKAALMSAVLLYNPIYFNLSHTFMTDVNFMTLFILSLSLVYSFIHQPTLHKVVAILILSISITLLRQFGLLVPISFLFTTFFIKEKKLLWVVSAFLIFGITYYTLYRYESFLKSYLTPWSSYKFSNDIKPFEPEFWKRYWFLMTLRYKVVFIYLFFHTFVFAAAFLPAVLKQNKWWIITTVFFFNYAWVWYVYDGFPLQMNNVFLDTAVGTDTSHETLSGTFINRPHFYNAGVAQFLDVLKTIFIASGLSTVILHLWAQRKKSWDLKRIVFFLYLVVFIALYLSLVFIAESFFDRYFLPIIVLSLITLAHFSKHYDLNWRIVAPLLLFWMYISIGGTHDYFALNDARWQLVKTLREKEKVPSEKIHGSFEQVCWNESNNMNLWSFASLKTFDYVIQFHCEDSFMLYHEKVFQRFWPPQKDTIRLYKRYLFAKKDLTDTLPSSSPLSNRHER